MMRFGGTNSSGLHRIRLTHRPLGPIDLAEWSGIILGGGPYNVSDPADLKSVTQRRVESELLPLIDRIVDRDFPFLGCCYGVGTLGSVIGATVDRTYPEPVGAVTITLTAAGGDDPLFAELPDIFDAYGGHKEGATALPLPCRQSRILDQLPGPGLPCGQQRLCDTVSPRTGCRRDLHAHRRLQEPRLLSARDGGVTEIGGATTKRATSSNGPTEIHRTVRAAPVTHA